MKTTQEPLASIEFIANQLLRLRRAYPNQSEDFFSILAERIIAHKFSEAELTSTIDEVIDTYEYQTLTISAVLKRKIEDEKANEPTIVD